MALRTFTSTADQVADVAAWMGIPQAAMVLAQAVTGGLTEDAQIVLALGITASMVIAAIKGRHPEGRDDGESSDD